MIRVDEADPVGEIEPSFPYRDVTVRRGVEFKDYYEIQSEIGRGKFGTVYRCKEKADGLLLAAKLVNTVKKEDRRAVEREVDIMRRLQHPRLIQLYDAIDTGKQIYVILELIEGGELFERVIDDDFVLTERSCAVFMRQICEGVEFIHAQNILHLDLKPENILCLTKEGNRIKIIDFGLARQYDPSKKLQVLFGTPEFVAPEVVNFDEISFSTDMWSIGVICYVLLSGLSPFMGDTDIETMANVTVAKYDFDHDAFVDISEDAKDFIKSLLVKDKEGRASAGQCREHRWLARRIRKGGSEKPFIKIVAPSRAIDAKKQQIQKLVTDELDMTKDNLRSFVERWREHPDSPYLIEVHRSSNRANTDFKEISASLKGHSPSPCQSICSSEPSEALSSGSSPLDNKGGFLSVSNYSLALARRASERLVRDDKPSDPVKRIALAEEIIKLSEHLRAVAMKSTMAAVNNVDESDENGKSLNSDMKQRERGEKLCSIARQRKLNGTTFHSNSRSIERTDDCTLDNAFGSINRKARRVDKDSNNGEPDLTPPWRRSRTKRSFGETSRDVPRIAKLHDVHKSLNLDEPANTKDLLLHFLNEWEDVATTRSSRSCAGRKSVSVDLNGESVARKTISSLAEYFQSDRMGTSGSVAKSSSLT
ncbi:uncharacterized protein [Prorops nasuta]|uniref:uncharacterized protein isoform X2 n=1 Tax=Prorops nasuta TaxID=863751 RepID=UPI0034CFC90A